MFLFVPIITYPDQKLPALWGLAERYLNTGTHVFRIRTILQKEIEIDLVRTKPQPFYLRAFKILSYATIVVPLLALGFCLYNRNIAYSVKILPKADGVLTDGKNVFSDDYLLSIFQRLEPEDMQYTKFVCKQWKRVSEEEKLYTIPDNVNVICKEVWSTHVDLAALGIDVSDAPKLSKRVVVPILRKFLKYIEIEGRAGVTLLTMPKNITLNIFIKIAKSKNVPISFINPNVVKELGDVPVTKTYVDVISNAVLLTSRTLPYNDQRRLLAKKRCKVPKLLEMMALNIMTHVSVPKQISPRFLRINSCGVELVNNFNVLVDYASTGLKVSIRRYGDSTAGIVGIVEITRC